MYRILFPVGRDAQNAKGDVLSVQWLLNRRRFGNLRQLNVDGVCGPKTVDAILDFQRTIKTLSRPDGVVSPDGPTFKALSQPPALPVVARSPERLPTQIAWGAKVRPLFRQKVIQICERLAMSPDYLMAAMAFESGETFRSDIKNAAGSGAVGLIQFMPNTAKLLGTTVEALATMSNVDQLDYVEKYFAPRASRLGTLEDIYMAILWPKAIGKGADYILFRQGSAEKPSKTYNQNAGLDRDKDGQITVAEAAAKVRAKLQKGLQANYLG